MLLVSSWLNDFHIWQLFKFVEKKNSVNLCEERAEEAGHSITMCIQDFQRLWYFCHTFFFPIWLYMHPVSQGWGKRSSLLHLIYFLQIQQRLKKEKKVMSPQAILERWATVPLFHPSPLVCPTCLCPSTSFTLKMMEGSTATYHIFIF